MSPFFNTRTLAPDAAVSGGVQLRSAVSPWVRFTWQTAAVPELSSGDSSNIIRPALKEESQKVLEVILNSLALDSDWNHSYTQVEQYLKDAVTRLLAKEDVLCLVVPKGNRFVAASLMDSSPEASSQLISGPAVLTEYRNRGVGSRLLQVSLLALRDCGLSTASGLTRANTVGASHVYSKFGGVGEPISLFSLNESSEDPKI